MHASHPSLSRSSTRRARARGLVGLAALLVAPAGATAAPAARPASAASQATPRPAPGAVADSLFRELRYRHIGPAGNRVIAVAGQSGNPDIYYVGAASGGVFKSVDGGHAWTPVFDDQPAASIGAIAVAPSDPQVVWVGTGETFIRANISIGNGVYRSTDGGDSWRHAGLGRTGRIGRIVVDPRDPDVALVCALGHTYGPQPERGVYRTRDGGETWERVLFVDENTGCSDLAMDPANPRRLYAGMWQIEVRTWGRWSGGPGSGLWTSRDGGGTWTRLEGSGLPDPPWGKIGLGLSPADPDRVYALIETSSNRDFAPSDPFQGVLWRSDDGGESWRMVNASNDLAARPLYYSRLAVSPADADEVYFLAPRHSTSLDGGSTHFRTDPQPGYDHHDMWIDPADPDRMIVGHDGGVSVSTTAGDSWHRPQLPIAQMYHANVDDRIPYFVYGNRQDGPSTRGPSNSLAGGEIPIGAWRSVGGCEVGFAVPDTVDERTVWAGCYDGILERHDLATGTSRDVSPWPLAIESWAALDLEYRWQWTFPIAISPHDHRRVYVGSQHVHRTTDGGMSWEAISPDLTSDDPELQRRTGGLTLDDAGPTIAPVVFAIAESPLEEGLIWAGTNDGRLHVTRDGGGSWNDVTANLPGLPPRGTISNVEPSRHAPGTAYLTVDRHQLGDFDPYVYRTGDYGRTWRRIDAAIPRSVFSFAHCVREDPARPGLLFLGTENGVWVSFDDGADWRSLQSNLPHAPVHWLVVQEHFSDLVVATYGRGFWIMDDITPLRELEPAEGSGAGGEPGRAGSALAPRGLSPGGSYLFSPRSAYRFRSREAPMSQPDDPAAGENPEYGASLHYFLDAREDGGDEPDVSLVILDATQDTVRALEDLDAGPGLHRVHWDLRTDPTPRVELRTPPEENPHVPVPERGWRDLPDGGRLSLLVPPGTYTVRLAVGDSAHERELTVWRDPGAPGSAEEIEEGWRVLRDLYDMLERSARTINEIESLRQQIGGLRDRLSESGRDDAEALEEPVSSLARQLKAIEGEFFDLRHTGQGQDGLRWPRLLYARIEDLADRIGATDERPTSQQIEVHRLLSGRLDAVEARFHEVLDGALAGLNATLRERGVPHLLLRSAP